MRSTLYFVQNFWFLANLGEL